MNPRGRAEHGEERIALAGYGAVGRVLAERLAAR